MPHGLVHHIGVHREGEKEPTDNTGLQEEVGRIGRGTEAVVGSVLLEEGDFNFGETHLQEGRDATLRPGTNAPAKGMEDAKGIGRQQRNCAYASLPRHVGEEVFVALFEEDVVDKFKASRQGVGLPVEIEGRESYC